MYVISYRAAVWFGFYPIVVVAVQTLLHNTRHRPHTEDVSRIIWLLLSTPIKWFIKPTVTRQAAFDGRSYRLIGQRGGESHPIVEGKVNVGNAQIGTEEIA